MVLRNLKLGENMPLIVESIYSQTIQEQVLEEK